jgi:sialate O-acetylesterase
VPAVVSGDTIALKGANAPDVTRVRYAWADAPYVNLYSADNLPAVPFEMDVK